MTASASPVAESLSPEADDETFARTYRRHFAVVKADNAALVTQAQRLRHEVYRVEHDYERASAHGAPLEHDRYDAHASHGLLMHRASRDFIGTVRVIRPNAERPQDSFPFQRLCKKPLDMVRSTVEVSRFCISRRLRSKAKFAAGDAVSQAELRSLAPFVSLGLMRSVIQMAVDAHARQLVAVMEPWMLNRLASLGLFWQPVGPLVDFHGERQPAWVNIERMLADLKTHNFAVWRVVTDHGRLSARIAGDHVLYA